MFTCIFIATTLFSFQDNEIVVDRRVRDRINQVIDNVRRQEKDRDADERRGPRFPRILEDFRSKKPILNFFTSVFGGFYTTIGWLISIFWWVAFLMLFIVVLDLWWKVKTFLKL
jgi:hypothetical protein